MHQKKKKKTVKTGKQRDLKNDLLLKGCKNTGAVSSLGK